MDAITINAEPREAGKKQTRAVRSAGNVPCVLYGHHTDTRPFQVPHLDIQRLVYSIETSRIQIALDGETYDCILKDVDFHPVTDYPIHADFQVLEKGQRITLTVPVQYHGVPAGQTAGGDTQYVMHEVTISCLPDDIPSHIDVDVSELEVGDALHIADLELPGITFEDVPEQTLVTVVPPRALEVEEEEAVAEALALEEGEGAAEEEGAAEAEEEGEEESE